MKIEMLRIQYDYSPQGPIIVYMIDCNNVERRMFDVGMDMLGAIGKFLSGESIHVCEYSKFSAVYYHEYFDIPDSRMYDMFLRICLSATYNSNYQDQC